ncbi:MAG: endolytic transglycosylase MltG [Zetaproteobacteria bacterium]|nr:MAG: endolytic transglycosylase MltG [Zetaproteobacteria bacterium]
MVLLGGVLLLLVGIAAWGWRQCHVPVAPRAPTLVEIPHGASSKRIATLLYRKHLIVSPFWFDLAVRWQGRGARLVSGVYAFSAPANMLQLIDRLARGDVAHFYLTVPEGLRNDEVLALLARETGVPLRDWRQALARLLPDGEEGRLLPETYRYSRPLQPERMLRRMLDAQRELLQSLAPDSHAWPRLRIIASIIEKETARPEERPLVSAVIHNRLRLGMPLQMDPTVIYGIWKTTGRFSGNIRKRDLTTDTPWNTYTRHGLPPTPICNPGAAALRAAARPAKVPYLYFVADGSGGHAFASTLEEHQRNVQRWLRIERTR